MKCLLTVTAWLFPLAVFALGLGDIDVRSGLNQRLDAHISLVSVRSVEPGSIVAGLGDADAFRQAGIERPHHLTGLRFEVVEGEGGGHFVRVTSRERIREPALHFVLDVQWPSGRARRAYTVLLRPR